MFVLKGLRNIAKAQFQLFPHQKKGISNEYILPNYLKQEVATKNGAFKRNI